MTMTNISIEPIPQPNESILRRLEFYFASLTVLGGFVLAVGNDGEVIPMIAVFFAIVGYVFVDLLKLIALPPMAAYIAMALAAVFCIADFTDGDAAGPRQLLAVAHLLVLVQAILMMQRKTKRIFEQLGIFCLLELIVAAVFNDALVFGVLLIPIAGIGALALGLMATASTVDSFGPDYAIDSSANVSASITTTAGESTRSATALANQYASMAVLILAPAVMIVATVFFYALPRISESARTSSRDKALVGFSDRVHLKQIGQMLLNPQIALRVNLSDRATGTPYRSRDGLYLRGRVLERYLATTVNNQQTATWGAIPIDAEFDLQPLPPEYVPKRLTDTNFYDTVNVSIDCEAMRSNSLFAIAPYYRLNLDREIVHLDDRWTIGRRGRGDWARPQIEYAFGTNAFREGLQTDLIARAPDTSDDPDRRESYTSELLTFDSSAMPSIARIAARLSIDKSGKRLSNYEIGKAIESHFSASGTYRYTLDLQSKSVANLDPIEQFVAVDRSGHCQYFASAMAMMLRSQRIPARIVVGYHTDEYNQWANQYVARQSHAHAWVEALVDRDHLGQHPNVYGQQETDQYWLRLDPTPSSSQSGQEPGLVRQGIDIAQELWDDNIIEMDADRQQDAAIAGGLRPSGQWYDSAVDWLSEKMRSLRSGKMDVGSLTSRELFSWPAALFCLACGIAIIVILRLRFPKWIRRRPATDQAVGNMRPKIEFYATALDQLERVGIRRHMAQTPREFVAIAADQMEREGVASIQGPMERLTATFYRQRFGGPQQPAVDHQNESLAADLATITASVQTVMRLRCEQQSAVVEINSLAKKEPTA